MEITDRVVVAVNLMDEARRRGLEVDTRSLAGDLGVPVVPIVARTSENLMALLNDIRKARPPQAKGQYLKRLTLASTTGPGVGVDQASIVEVEQP